VPKINIHSLFAAACCGCNPAAAAASTVFFSLWIAAAAVQTAATVSACSQPNTPTDEGAKRHYSYEPVTNGQWPVAAVCPNQRNANHGRLMLNC
jgi:hypothetical protein